MATETTVTLPTFRLSVLTATASRLTLMETVALTIFRDKKRRPVPVGTDLLLPRAYGLLRPTTKLFCLWVK